jgi:hypothetical protein
VPLNLEVLRRGERVKYRPFDWFVLNAVYTAAMKEAMPDGTVNDQYTWGSLPEGQVVDWSWLPIYYMDLCPLLAKGRQTLEQDHRFVKTGENGKTRKVVLKKGDVLHAWRSMS